VLALLGGRTFGASLGSDGGRVLGVKTRGHASCPVGLGPGGLVESLRENMTDDRLRDVAARARRSRVRA